MTTEGRIVDGDGRNVLVWGVAMAPKKSETESGDTCVMQESPEGLLIAAIDGAGHGAEAAAAARIAEETLSAHADESPISLVLRCHDGLRNTRGAVMTLVACDLRDRTLTWLGVGNVDAILWHAVPTDRVAADRIVLRGGVVGYQLPALRAEVMPLKTCDTLILATDGIEEHFADDVALHGEPQEIANRILAAHRKETDDALVVVVRYFGADGRDRN
jgi:hypothetical protein